MPVVLEGPDFARKISAVRTEAIRENIEAAQLANLSSAINIAADYAYTSRVRIIENRINRIGRFRVVLSAGAPNKAFADAPPVVFAAASIGRFLHADLFATRLSHVGDKHRARPAIPTELK